MEKNISKIILLFTTFLYSCSNNKYFNDFIWIQPKKIYYKLITFEDQSKKVKVSDYVNFKISYSTIDDSIFFIAERIAKMNKPEYPGSIEDCFLMLYEGDSASFIINTDSFFIKTLKVSPPDFLPSGGYFKVNIKILNVKTEQEFEKERKMLLAWLNDFSEYEKELLSTYLTNSKINYLPSDTLFYKIIKIEGNKNKCIDLGDTITINYEGHFFNGKLFDSTIKRREPFTFIYGTEYQVIKGLEKALHTMCEGEYAIIILPSTLAFGNHGSSSGIVPPFTPVIYEVKVEKVGKRLSF